LYLDKQGWYDAGQEAKNATVVSVEFGLELTRLLE